MRLEVAQEVPINDSGTDGPLPDFTAPPIAEVVLGVQFEPLTQLRAAHFGLLWERYVERFPKTQEHAPLDPVVEEFGTQRLMMPGIQIQVAEAPLVPRCWFLNDDETELIQIQPDRFIVNWRRGGGSYPRFRRVRELFSEGFAIFEQFLLDKGLGMIRPTQCEVTYIDHIEAGDVWEEHGQLDRVFTGWAVPAAAGLSAELENARFTVRYVMRDEEAKPLGRLHVEVLPAFRRADDLPIFVLNTTARGRPLGEGIVGIEQFFERGRLWAVRAFDAFTSPAMHAAWGRDDA